MFQLQFYSSSQLVFFHSTTNCCICLFVRENSIKFLIGLHMWQQGISHLTAVHPSFSGRDIARRCENMAESCPAQSTCPSPSGSGLQRRLSPHQPPKPTCSVRALLAQREQQKMALQVPSRWEGFWSEDQSRALFLPAPSVSPHDQVFGISLIFYYFFPALPQNAAAFCS